MMKSVAVLVLFLVVCLGTGYLGSIVTAESVRSWYPTIAKPAWNPPDWVFAPVWTTLFILMGVSAWLVWRQGGFSVAAAAFGVFALQLILNLAWSVLFFGMQRPGIAAIEIVLLWSAILTTLFLFSSHSRLAALLLAPYLVWVTFAAFLNYSIWRLNS